MRENAAIQNFRKGDLFSFFRSVVGRLDKLVRLLNLEIDRERCSWSGMGFSSGFAFAMLQQSWTQDEGLVMTEHISICMYIRLH